MADEPTRPLSRPPQSKTAALSAVKHFNPPAAPSAPHSLSSSLASDLSTYESTAVDLAPKEAKHGKQGEEIVEERTLDSLFEEMKQPLPAPTGHH